MKLYSKNQRVLDLSQAQVMGILNVTPDSFSDSGKFFSLDKALYHAEEMLKLLMLVVNRRDQWRKR